MSEYFRSLLVSASLLFSCCIFGFYYTSFHTSLLQNTANLFSCIIKIPMYFSDLTSKHCFLSAGLTVLIFSIFLLAPAHWSVFYFPSSPSSSQEYSLLLFSRDVFKKRGIWWNWAKHSACSVKSEWFINQGTILDLLLGSTVPHTEFCIKSRKCICLPCNFLQPLGTVGTLWLPGVRAKKHYWGSVGSDLGWEVSVAPSV